MKIAIVGTGGVGGYFGGLMAHAGQDVTFLARGAHLASIRQSGLRLKTVHGDYAIVPAQATDKMSEIGQADLVIVSVKDYQLEGVIDEIRLLLHGKSRILPLLNGVQAADALREAYGTETVLGGLCRVVAFIVKPGLINQTSPFRSLTFGEWNGQQSESSRAILAMLREADIEATLSSDIYKAMWTKFIFITSYSGVASVVRLPAGGLRTSAETVEMLRLAMEEIKKVALSRGIILDEDIIDKSMAFFRGFPDDATASMQRDVAGGRIFELEALTGSLIRFAREEGIDTPVNDFIYAALKPQLIQAQNQEQ